jgi:hypothetical protein
MDRTHSPQSNQQLCWLPKFGGNGQLALHLRKEPYHPWKLYTHFPELCTREYAVPNGSKGWATAQKLLQSGWSIVPTAQARLPWSEDSRAA